MKHGTIVRWERTAGVAAVFMFAVLMGADGSHAAFAQSFQIRLDTGHPWRPPFGLGRIGRPITVLVSASQRPEGEKYVLTVLSRGKDVGQHDVRFSTDPPTRLACRSAQRPTS